MIKGDWDIKIKYELPPQDTEQRDVTFSCDERPRKEFVEAFKAIKTDVIGICGLDSKIWELGYISSISFKDEEEGTKVAIELRAVSEQSIITAGVESLYPIGEFLEKICNLIAEVEDYIDGVRQVQQMSINDFLPKDAGLGTGFAPVAPVAPEEEEETLEL
jgi:hypothetical protein